MNTEPNPQRRDAAGNGAASGGASGVGPARPSSARLRVLLVDDSLVVRERLADMVGQLAHVELVGAAADGNEGWAWFQARQPDAVVLDLELPGISGLELLYRIKQARPSCAVLVLTTHAEQSFRERCKRLGADCFFYKATEFERVMEELERLAGARLAGAADSTSEAAGGPDSAASKPEVRPQRPPAAAGLAQAARTLPAQQTGGETPRTPCAVLEELVQLAALICDTPMAFLSETDGNRHRIKTGVGVPLQELACDHAWLDVALQASDLTVIPNVASQPALTGHPLFQGPSRVLFCAAMPLQSPAGRPLGLLAVMDTQARDLTPAQRRGLTALARTATELVWRPSAVVAAAPAQGLPPAVWERLAAAVEQVAEAVVLTDANGRIEYVNPAFERITGYRREEVLGQNPRLLKSGRHPVSFYEHLWQTITAGRTWSGRFTNRRKNGTLYEEEATISPVQDARGQITHFIAVKEDVTLHRRAIEALARSEAQYRALVEASPDAVFTLRPPDWTLASANAAALALFGADHPDQLLSRHLEAISPERQPDGELSSGRARQHIEAALSHGCHDFYWTHQRLDGRPIPAAVRLRRLELEGVELLQATVRDLTALQRAERQVHALAQLAQQLSAVDTAQRAAQAILDTADVLLGWDAAYLHLWDEARQQITPVLTVDTIQGRKTALAQASFQPPPSSLFVRALRQGALLEQRAPGTPPPPRNHRFGDPTRTSASLMAAPIRHGPTAVGVVSVQSYRPNAYDASDLDTLQALADHCAGALQRLAAQEALRASEQRFRDIIEHASDIMALVAPDGRLVYVSPSVQRVLGLSPATVVGSNVLELVHPDDQAQARQALRRAAERGAEPVSVTVRVRHADGSWPTLEVIGKPDGTEPGGPLVVLNARDMTERQEAAARIQQLNRLLQAVRAVDQLIVRATNRQQLLQEACEILVQTRNFLTAWVGVPDAASPKVLAVARAGQAAALLDQLAVTYDQTATGQGLMGTAIRQRTVQVCQDVATDPRVAPWRSVLQKMGASSAAVLPLVHGGNLFGTVAVYADRPGAFDADEIALLEQMTNDLAFALHSIEAEHQRRQAEEQIKAQARLLDLAQDAIVVCDLEGRVAYWNEGAASLYGWPVAQARGRTVTELCGFEQFTFQAACQTLLQAGQWADELAQKTRAGRALWVSSRWTLVRDAEGPPRSVLMINTDVTEKKQLQAQYLRAQRLESVGRLAGSVAHDLNNVLSPIVMAADIWQHEAPNEELRLLALTVEQSAKRGADIVKQLLLFARGSEGQKLPVLPEPLLKELGRMIRSTFPKDIQLRLDVPADLWPITADPTQIHQVLLNLCVNARDAMPAGGCLTLTAANVRLDECYARLNPDAKVGAYVVIEVADTGTGMTSEVLEKIFEPFFTTKSPDKGTGLGLATVQAITKGHGGFIEVESQVGRGSHFRVYLPATPGAGSDQSSPAAAPPRGSGELVLVADDERTVLEVLQQTLEKNGYRVLTAEDGTGGLALYAQHRADIRVVLTDMMMPVMDGPTMIRALRLLNPEVRVIGTSGLASHRKLGQQPELRLAAYIPKPFTTESLLVTLREVLDRPAADFQEKPGQ